MHTQASLTLKRILKVSIQDRSATKKNSSGHLLPVELWAAMI